MNKRHTSYKSKKDYRNPYSSKFSLKFASALATRRLPTAAPGLERFHFIRNSVAGDYAVSSFAAFVVLWPAPLQVHGASSVWIEMEGISLRWSVNARIGSRTCHSPCLGGLERSAAIPGVVAANFSLRTRKMAHFELDAVIITTELPTRRRRSISLRSAADRGAQQRVFIFFGRKRAANGSGEAR